MNDTQTTSLFTDLTTEESATINGAYGYGYRPYAWWRNRRYHPVAYRPYNNNKSTTVNVKVNVNVAN